MANWLFCMVLVSSMLQQPSDSGYTSTDTYKQA